MPIGAAIGVGVLGAGATVYSSSKAAKAQKDAAKTAAQTQATASTQTSDIALKLADKNNAFAQSMYDQNEGHLSPFINFGTAGGNSLMELLLGKPPATPSTAPTWGNPTGTPTPTPPPTPTPSTGQPGTTPTPTGYTGPGLNAISSQAQMDAYLNYYRAHPDQDPGFTSISQFHGDPWKNEDSASAVLAARNAYVAAHPVTAPPAAPATQQPAPSAVSPNNALASTVPTTGAAAQALAANNIVSPNNAAATAAPTAPASTLDNKPRLHDYVGNPDAFHAAMSEWRDNRSPAAHSIVPGSGTPNAVAAAAGTPATTPPAATGATTPAATPPATNAAQDAWDTFRNSTNYQFRLNQGLDSTATKYAAAGAFESGAEKKAINDYAQNFASNELANYMDRLYQQEALGASAASSLAGVGTNLVSQVSANNNNAAATAINGVNNAASANGNAALINGNATAGQWNAIGGAVGTAAGAIGGALSSSYAAPNNAALQASGIYDGAGWNF